MTPLPIERIAELERLDAEVDRCRKIVDEGNDGFYMQVTYAEEGLGHALARDSKALLAAARELADRQAAIDHGRALLLEIGGNCEESWQQSDSTFENAAPLADALARVVGYPEYDEQAGKCAYPGWPPTGKAGT